MRAQSVKADEQYRLIMECRSSGLTDHQWCMEHDIKPGTFYNWVKRLRKSGCKDIPAASRSRIASRKQEIVQIELTEPVVAEDISPTTVEPQQLRPVMNPTAMMEILSSDWQIRIPNGTDPVLLRTVLQAIGNKPC